MASFIKVTLRSDEETILLNLDNVTDIHTRYPSGIRVFFNYTVEEDETAHLDLCESIEEILKKEIM